ncbi:glycosyltransferase, partial [Bdellovibrionota bacterium FG-1]
NGLNSKRFAAVHEFQNLHLIYKKRIQEFVMAHFFPSYTFDLSKTLHIFTSGRYEHRNKGFDLFIESLARLNWRLKAEKKDVTVIAFIVTRAQNFGFNGDTLKNQMFFREMRNQCETIASGVASKLLFESSTGIDPKNTSIVDEHELHALKRLTRAWKHADRLPTICTHQLENKFHDPVVNQLQTCGLVNRPEDPVKVVYHPEFMTAASPLLNLDYEQFVRGCHLGVFPSYYEPWGYTPEECAALGIPSVTSDLSGFGGFVREKIQKHAEKGLFVIDRRYRSFHESADQLADTIFKIMTMSMRERIELRNRVEAESVKFDWNELIPAYRRAQRIALARGRARRTRKKMAAT